MVITIVPSLNVLEVPGCSVSFVPRYPVGILLGKSVDFLPIPGSSPQTFAYLHAPDRIALSIVNL